MPRKGSPLDALRIKLALKILSEAAQVAPQGQAATPAVRLALYVLHPHLRDPELVREYWSYAVHPVVTTGHTWGRALRWIETCLRDCEWLAPEVHLKLRYTPMIGETDEQFEARTLVEQMLTQDDVAEPTS